MSDPVYGFRGPEVRRIRESIRVTEAGERQRPVPERVGWRPSIYYARPTATVEANSEGTLTIWAGEPGSESSSGVTLPDVFNRNVPIQTSQTVLVAHNGTRWHTIDKTDACVAKLSGSLARDGTQGATIWMSTGGAAEAATSSTINVRGWLIPTGETLASGARVVCQWINGYWYVTQSDECTA